jgi:hypothetical protein
MTRRFFAPRRRAVVALLAVLVPLTFAGAASAEFPYMNQRPSILGGGHSVVEGQTLNGQTGLWLFTSGLKCNSPECTYRYEWERCDQQLSGCGSIAGATAYDYTTTAADVGFRLRFVEYVFKRDCDALNQNCRDIEQNGVSDPTGIVQPRAQPTPQNTAVPTIVGTAMEDEVLRANGGTWTGPEPITKTWQWQRCDATGTSCGNVAGATAGTFKLTSADVGSRLRVVELATNAGGQSFAGSLLTAVVAELRPTATKRSIAVTKVSLPHYLILRGFSWSRSGSRLTVRFRVWDDRGFQISGALVGVTAVPGLPIVRERRSDRQGWATFTYAVPQSLANGTLVYFFVTARKVGERPQEGVSTSTLYRLRLR